MSAQQTSQAGSAAKKVAMRLQTLTPEDRSWLLTRLSRDQREEVIEAEQALLKITGDTRLNFDQFIHASGDGESTPPKTVVFERWSVTQVTKLLDSVPPLWVAGIFHYTTWRGADRYLMDQNTERRKAIQAGHHPLKPKACLALCRTLERSLREG